VINKLEELKFVLIVSVLGLCFDAFNNIFFHFEWKSNYLSWLAPIWIMFSLTLNHSLAFIFKNKVILFLFSFVGGPWAYLAASKILPFNYKLDWIIIVPHGLLWVVFIFLVKILREKICRKKLSI
jgi:hypothetical protein